MFAMDHAATVLLVKRRYPSVPMAPLLVAVQAMELAWVVFNYPGIERTTTERVVRSVADIHLSYMPYSHSVASGVGTALLVWLIIEKGLGHRALGRALGLGIVSHLVLDLATHGYDIALWPGSTAPKLGLGLYDSAPFDAFIVEFVYGVLCWYVFPGRARPPDARLRREPREPFLPVGDHPGPGTVSRRAADIDRDTHLHSDRRHPRAGRRAGP